MTTDRVGLLKGVQDLRAELGRLMDGIDYCFDWKPTDGEWSAREVAYHLVDTPKGGVHAALRGMLDGTLHELKIDADLTNLDEERRVRDFVGVKEDLEDVLAGLEQVLSSATDEQLEGRQVPVLIQRNTGTDAHEWSPGYLAHRTITGHWPTHLHQLAELREALGID